ncbi:MAG: tRNA-intron lyase [Candidatus Heimdallarchaeota archaeon]|nr:tRNA-intron lyase [Candidatus Heimdallarchaeota archaeon]
MQPNEDKKEVDESIQSGHQQSEESENESDSIITKLEDEEVIVKDHQDARIIYDNGYYGLLRKDKTLSLNFDEALHLLERGVITIANEKGRVLTVRDCAVIFTQREEGFWKKYLVYKDLRNRGYIVGRGISPLVKYRLYPRGATVGKDIAKTMICPLAEDWSINLEELDKIILQAQSLKKKLLVACVDRLGDVSYYEIQSLFQ